MLEYEMLLLRIQDCLLMVNTPMVLVSPLTLIVFAGICWLTITVGLRLIRWSYSIFLILIGKGTRLVITSYPLGYKFVEFLSKRIKRFSTLAGSVKTAIFPAMAAKLRSMVISFGPNHPAAHGILRLNFNLQGEILQKVDPQFGFLHRGTEKLAEQRSWLQNVPYFDRFDYVANLFQEHAYCQAVEQLTFQPTATYALSPIFMARVMFDELSRLMNHLLTLGAVCLDIGAMGPIFWAFEERERLMEFYERTSGARMHTALYKPHDFDWSPLTTAFCTDLSRFLFRCGRSINGAVMGLANNKILKTRLSGVGSLSPIKLANYSITGVIARSAGLRTDLRKVGSHTYRCYQMLTFKSFLGTRGDNLDRFLIRIKEAFETFHIVGQSLAALVGWVGSRLRTTSSTVSAAAAKPLSWVALRPTSARGTKFSSMESLIQHFKNFSGSIRCIRGVVYGAVESPKGEMGVTLISTGGQYPYRLKVRSPVAHNMHLILLISQGVLMGDFVMIFCSLDVVLGEIDR